MGRVGIIGGTGLGEALGALGTGELREVETPFGRPSGPITLTEVEGVPVALLARHGPGHLLHPGTVPYRANLFALKQLGVTHVLASGACGSLREELPPRSLVIPDQTIDKTYRREPTFFDGLAVHTELGSPFCSSLREVLRSSAPGPVHPQGTYVCMEGPAFSTRAESLLHRSMGADLIGMTLMPEAKLAREAELHYAAVCLVTDYDCWRPHDERRDRMALLEELISNLRAATQKAMELIRAALPRTLEADPRCGCQDALGLAIFSNREAIPAATRERLAPLLKRYL